jgi:hypothetical protein
MRLNRGDAADDPSPATAADEPRLAARACNSHLRNTTMGSPIFRLLPALAAAMTALPLSLSPATAEVVDVSSLPARTTVAAGSPASVTVTWQVVRSILEPLVPGTVSSSSIQVLIGGSQAATLPRALSRGLPGAAILETATLREVVPIPEALVYRAVKQGATLELVRSFVDSVDGIAATGAMQVTPTGPGSVALQVDRLALSFSDDARTRIVARGDEVHAVAEINSAGVGLITGQWEAASAATTAGAPVFRPLSLVRQGVAGGGRTVITSPRLPAAEEGTHLVRFRVVEPALLFEAPVLQYYVTPRAPAAAPAVPRQIAVTEPGPEKDLVAGTRFAWNAVDGAEAYQVAFYATPAGPAAPLDPAESPELGAQVGANAGANAGTQTVAGAPLAGIFVPGDRSAAVPEAFTLAQLPGSRSYLWQVLAIDANGAVIGSSSARNIYKP